MKCRQLEIRCVRCLLVVGISQEQHLHHADQGNPLPRGITSQSTTSLPAMEFAITGQRGGLGAVELFSTYECLWAPLCTPILPYHYNLFPESTLFMDNI